MIIECDYPGGNIILNKFFVENGRTVVDIEQDVSTTEKWWFYWSFRVRDAVGEVFFKFSNGKVVSNYGAAISYNLTDWQWSDKSDIIDNESFKYTFKEGEIVYFAFCPQYQTAQLEALYNDIKNDESVILLTLAQSEQGRNIPLLKLGNGSENIIFTSRHHCCEATGCYTLEGAIREILTGQRSLLEKYTFHIIPFIDIDGVENGDQGKDRPPHDHNRDYTENPIYNSIRALKKYVENMKITAFIDFHSPWKWGEADSQPHIHLSPENEVQSLFIEELKKTTAKREQPSVLYTGIVSNYGSNVNKTGTTSAKNYFCFEKNARLSISLETPYSGNLPNGYTIENIKNFGRDVASALSKVTEKFV